MTTTHTPAKANRRSFKRTMRLLRRAFADVLLSALYANRMYVSATPRSAVAGCAVFWYFENGMRHFLMVKEEGEGLKFLSCLGTTKNNDIAGTLHETVKNLLGSMFYRAVDVAERLGADRVVAVPAFKLAEPQTGTLLPVHAAVWCVQVTPEQADMRDQQREGRQTAQVIVVPEYVLMSPDIAPSHQQIYQTILRHIHTDGKADVGEALLEQLEEMMPQGGVSVRVLH